VEGGIRHDERWMLLALGLMKHSCVHLLDFSTVTQPGPQLNCEVIKQGLSDIEMKRNFRVIFQLTH